MRSVLGFAILAMLVPFAPVVAVAKGPAVMVEVVHQLATPAGKVRPFKQYITAPNAAQAKAMCESIEAKPAKFQFESIITDYKGFVGSSFVSSGCTKKGGEFWISTGRIGRDMQPTPTVVGFYFKDKAGKVKTLRIDNARAVMSMTQCRAEIRHVTSENKTRIPKTIPEFAGMTFVKSECVFTEDFKL